MVLRLGRVEIDLDRIEVRVDGVLQPVQPQVFEVIRYLVERRDRLVTKEELLDNVWGDRFVSESTLTSRIKSARRVLGDNGRDQTMIRTVHGRGYRFVAEPDGAVPVHGGTSERAAPPVSASEPRDRRDEWPLIGRYELLERIGDVLAEPGVGGVVLTGPAGIGKTRLALEALRTRAGDGGLTYRVTASAASAAVPLAALTPVTGSLDTDVGGLAPDLARAAIFRRAVTEIETRAESSGRLLVMVDEIDRLDEMSTAVLSSTMESEAVSVVGTSRSGAGSHPFQELVRAGRICELDVPPMDDTDVDVALYRVLQGPVDLASLERLGALSRGRPGLLRDLVESSQAAGSLRREDEVWRLVGPVASSASDRWPPDGLDATAVSAAEVLSLVADLRLDDAEALVGAAALDALDSVGLLALERDGNDMIVRLDDPLLAETVQATIGPIRARRHRLALVEVLARSRRPSDLASIVRWADELDRPLDPLDSLVAAQSALRHGNDDAAEALVDQLDPSAGGPYPLVIKAELAYRRRQHRRAEEMFRQIDLSAVDTATAGFVLRRAATLRYQLHAEYRGAIDWLAAQERQVEPELAVALGIHRVTLLTLLGCVDEALLTAEPLLVGTSPAQSIEVQLASARAHVLRGELDRALAIVDAQREALGEVRLTGPEARLPAEAALTITLTALVDRGDVIRAEELLRDDLVVTGRTSRTWSPLSAADVALEVGRARMAIELIRPALEAYRATGMDNGRLSCLAMQARAFAESGQRRPAEDAIGELSADLDLAVGANRWFVAAALARATCVLGRGHEHVGLLVDQAESAESWGARGAAANLLALAGVLGGGSTAQAVTDRVADLASGIDGRLWPVRLAHLRAVADGGDVGPAREGYLRLGYRSLAALVDLSSERAAAEPA